MEVNELRLTTKQIKEELYMNDNKIVFDLLCPPSVSDLSIHYLGLVELLVNQLRKYTEVEVIHEDVFDAFHRKINRENEEKAFYSICQKARLEGTSIEELVDKYGFETLGFSRETYEMLTPKTSIGQV